MDLWRGMREAVGLRDKRKVQELLEIAERRGVNIQDLCKNALLQAVENSSLEIISLLLDRGTDINTMGDDGNGTALHAAAYSGKEGTVSLLLDRGADINAVGGRYRAVLGAAVQGGKKEIISLLLDRGANINAVGGMYGPVLGTAVQGGKKEIIALLLDRGADINAVGGEYGTALCTAARGGYGDIVSLLLDRGADINAVGGEYRTALGVAVFRGKKEIISLLLDRGADINAVGGKYGAALGIAVLHGKEEIVSLLLDRGADINAVGGEYGTALCTAAGREYKNIVSLLLDRGADISAVGGSYGTALGVTAFTGNKEIISLLLDRGAHINTLSGQYGTALGVATFAGNKEVVSLLLDRGADINSLGGEYGSALGAAACNGWERIVSLLLNRGADINAIGGTYGTALGAAVQAGKREIVLLLLDRGADISAVGGEYGTPLGVAAFTGNEEIVLLLLGRGADIQAVGGKYRTALGAAVQGGKTGIVSLLLDRGADINAVCGAYGTALGMAVSDGDKNIASLLLGRGADINAVSGEYGTALGVAAFNGQGEIVSWLLDRGADISAVHGRYGTALGVAAYKGHKSIVSLLLDRGAVATFVGGRYETVDGEYPTAVHAAQSGCATPDLHALVEGALRKEFKAMGDAADVTHRPPFPMPHTPSRVESTAYQYQRQLQARTGSSPGTSTDSHRLEFRAGASITPEQADILCTKLNTDILSRSLLTLVGIHAQVSERLQGWIQNDIRYFVSQDFDFGMAYAAARIGWQHFNQLAPAVAEGEISRQRGRWLSRAKEIDEARGRAIHTDDKKLELIESPYSVMPRRIWDLRSNRVVAYRMLHAVAPPHQHPTFWAVTHSWTACMEAVDTSINQYQWPVPLPSVAELKSPPSLYERLVPARLLPSLYQRLAPARLLLSLYERLVPTRLLPSLYERPAPARLLLSLYERLMPTRLLPSLYERLVPARLFLRIYERLMPARLLPSVTERKPLPSRAQLKNGADLQSVRAELLSFGAEYVWIDVLCLRQQSNNPALEKIRQDEWKIDVPTIGNIYRAAGRLVRYFNGLGIPFSNENWDDPHHWLQRAWTLQEIRAENMTINGGMSQNAQGVLLNTRGKVGGKVTTLRRALLPVLNLTAELRGPSGCSMYQLAREMARRHATQPTDKVAGLLYLLHVAKLPAYNANTSAELAWQQCFRILPLKQQIEILFDFPYPGTGQLVPAWEQIMAWPERNPDYTHSVAAPLTSNDQQPQNSASLESVPLGIQENGGFYISPVLALSLVSLHALHDPGEYIVKSGDKSFPFYCPYLSQHQIETVGETYTLITLGLGQSSNWVVCKWLRRDKLHGRDSDGKDHVVQVKVFRKLGVLRTDFSREIWAWGINKHGALLTTINCLFV